MRGKRIKDILPLLLIIYTSIDVVDLGTEGFTCSVKDIPDFKVQVHDARFQMTVKSVELRPVSLPQAVRPNVRRVSLKHEVPFAGKFLFFSKKEIPYLKSQIVRLRAHDEVLNLKFHLWYGYCIDCGLRPDIVSLGIPVQPASIEILRMYGVTHTPSLVEVTGKELIIYEKDSN